MSFKTFKHTKSQFQIATDSNLKLTVPDSYFNSRIFPVFAILLINSVMLLSGIIEDVCELNYLFSEGAFSEAILVNIVNFILDPIMNSHFLIGLCWLFFIFFPARRIAIVLRKTARAFRETLQSFIGLNVHGCRAPPFLNS